MMQQASKPCEPAASWLENMRIKAEKIAAEL